MKWLARIMDKLDRIVPEPGLDWGTASAAPVAGYRQTQQKDIKDTGCIYSCSGIATLSDRLFVVNSRLLPTGK